jgi:GNAT superfamily N-acetyltransferase
MIIRTFHPAELESQAALLQTWSDITIADPNIVPETPDSLRANLLVMLVAFDGEIPVAFAGIIDARNAAGHGITWDGKRAVELSGAYVLPAYRNHGIWSELMQLRIALATEKGWLGLCVTGNLVVQNHLEKIGSISANAAEYADLRSQLCLQCTACTYCPIRVQRSVWIVCH